MVPDLPSSETQKRRLEHGLGRRRAAALGRAFAGLATVALSLATLGLGACGEPPGVASQTAPDGGEPAVDPPSPQGSKAATSGGPVVSPRVFLDLVSNWRDGHFRRYGPVIEPHGPGWASATSMGDKRAWLPGRESDTRPVAWPEGIGTTLSFPVGSEGRALRVGSLFVKGIAAGQRLSLFLDEQPLGTVDVPMLGRTMTFSLPPNGLEPGEHRLRLWFRFTRFVGKLRTPGAVGTLAFGPTAAETGPVAFREHSVTAGTKPDDRAPLALGPPAAWSHFVWLPPSAHLSARVQVKAQSPPVDVRVVLEVDGDQGPPVEHLIYKVRIAPATTASIEADLSAFGRRAVRLSLISDVTVGAGGPIASADAAQIIEATLHIPGVEATPFSPVRNVIVWTIDGLRSDRTGLGRVGERASTPNLDLLMREGAAASDVWSGGTSARDGHLALLAPMPGAPTLPAALVAAGRFVGFFGSTSATEDEVVRTVVKDFSTATDLHRNIEQSETRSLLRELDDWLDVRKKRPFVAYVATSDPLEDLPPPAGLFRMYVQRAAPISAPTEAVESRLQDQRDVLAAYDAQISAADYWVGQLVATLARHHLDRDTAIIVVGTVGKPLHDYEAAGEGRTLSGGILCVPLVLWHPSAIGLRPRPLQFGGSTHDVAQSIMSLAGVPAPSAWRGRDLVSNLLDGVVATSRPDFAQSGGFAAARRGDYWLRGSPRGVRLWNVEDDPEGRVDLSGRMPIALRVVRDGIMDAPQSPTQALPVGSPPNP